MCRMLLDFKDDLIVGAFLIRQSPTEPTMSDPPKPLEIGNILDDLRHDFLDKRR